MNTGQMFLTLGALIFLSTIMLRYNRAELTSDDILNNSKFNILAVSLCTSLIEEAKGKAFDEKTIDDVVISVSGLSSTLGYENAELNKDDFDDFDDYNGYIAVDSSMQSATFYVTSKVTYVNESDPNKISTSPTWYKAITVTVISSSMTDQVQMSSIYSYWFFR